METVEKVSDLAHVDGFFRHSNQQNVDIFVGYCCGQDTKATSIIPTIGPSALAGQSIDAMDVGKGHLILLRHATN